VRGKQTLEEAAQCLPIIIGAIGRHDIGGVAYSRAEVAPPRSPLAIMAQAILAICRMTSPCNLGKCREIFAKCREGQGAILPKAVRSQ
jgi:hypothetical protein